MQERKNQIEIKNRWTRAVLFVSETAASIAEAVAEAFNSGADLEDANLEGANLEGADLEGANLEGANLEGANLRGANLRGANLRGAYLRGANLGGANLRGANLEGADLEGANLEGADLEGANLEGADLEGANLRGADLRGAYLRGAKGLLKDGIVPLQISGTRHWLIVRTAGLITIGCHHKELTWWEEHYAAVGRKEGYTEPQIAEYRVHIAHARTWMEALGVVEVEKPAEATA